MKRKNSQPSELIVHSRDLVNSEWYMAKNQLRVINLALSKVDSRKPNPGRVRITADEYIFAYGVNKRQAVAVIRDAIQGLMEATITLNYPGVDEELRNKKINWLESADYPADFSAWESADLYITFSKAAEDLLFNLDGWFLSVPFELAAQLETPFAFKLYCKLLQFETSPNHRRDSYFEVDLSVDEIRKLLPSESKELEWKKISEKWIKPAIEKINATQPYSISYETQKNGKKTVGAKFICVPERAKYLAPVRPRLALYRKKSSLIEQSKWAQKVKDQLITYFQQVENYHGNFKSINADDFRRVAELCDFLGEKIPLFILKELDRKGRKARQIYSFSK